MPPYMSRATRIGIAFCVLGIALGAIAYISRPPPAKPWLTYISPISVPVNSFHVTEKLSFMIHICNNSEKELTNVGSFIWVHEDVFPQEQIVIQPQSNKVPIGCVDRTVVLTLPEGVGPGRWHYEGHVCPVSDERQCADFRTESFEILP